VGNIPEDFNQQQQQHHRYHRCKNLKSCSISFLISISPPFRFFVFLSPPPTSILVFILLSPRLFILLFILVHNDHYYFIAIIIIIIIAAVIIAVTDTTEYLNPPISKRLLHNGEFWSIPVHTPNATFAI
jgi:hypothetical protein